MSPPGLSCSLAHDEVALCTSATTLSTFFCVESYEGGGPTQILWFRVLWNVERLVQYLEHDTDWTICIDPFLFFNVARFVSLLDY